MSDYQVSIRPGNIARHTPKSAAAQGREEASLAFAAAVDGLVIAPSPTASPSGAASGR